MSQIDELVEQWLAIDINPQSRNEITQLQKQGKYDVLEKKLSKRIAFGTAGLRSSMESGFAHMNDVTVLQAAQGLIDYLDKKGGNSIVIGYDHRYHSQRFAELTASVAVLRNFTVYYLGSKDTLSPETIQLSNTPWENKSEEKSFVHTPLVPFAIDHFKASAGVMVTASHNPANDNGYKVYYGNGCQIIPPVDHDIAQSIENNLKPWDGVWDVTKHFSSDLVHSVKPEITQSYVKAVEDKLIKTQDLDFKFVYTPVHGVGLEIFEKVLSKFNSNMIITDSQKNPDPSFPTVKFPNPEEKGALDEAIKTADANGAELVIANDPDADRFTVSVKVNGKWTQLTGNEIGFLFAQYVIETTPADQLSNTYLLNSTVSSQILSSMAQKEGFHFQDTLTGFKWIGNKGNDLKNQGFNVPFGYEEAIGFMFDLVNDKDGITAAITWLQLYQKWFTGGENALDKLKSGYEKYGYFKECNGYYKLADLSTTDEIFSQIRSSFEGDQPKTIGSFTVKYWRDLTLGYETGTKDNKSILPSDPTSQMITAILGEDQVRFTCRGSGTEPKLKVYIEGKGSTEQEAIDVAHECWEILKQQWFKPEIFNVTEVLNQ
ncbi:phosphoribomutase [[Candida] jaroonii]|uniref:Phosphoribomutase n=1 Tax=[Candida] jaroonii TaxID=467808 RepID=A0ACA9Y7F1_9ASCO|nr:phosphoribomutase [[Candida] jaroonii]